MLVLLAFDDSDLTDAYRAKPPRRPPTGCSRVQVRVKGDWSVKLPDVEPGGWAFEYCNNAYPDIDDTAVALIALAPFRDNPRYKAKGIEEAFARAINWLIAMQSRGGGWGAFDKDNDQ